MFLIKSNYIQLHGVAESLRGGRQENQDDLGFLDTPLGFLFVVCDGMGGGPNGKLASKTVKVEVARALAECTSTTTCQTALRMAISKAQEALETIMKNDSATMGMGSTIVALLINKQAAYVAHVGDSRCYKFHGRRLLYRTTDHSLVAELVGRKVMSEEEARVSPQSNVITRGLGCVKNTVPDIDKIPYTKNDRFVLCTDGVWGCMPHKQLLKYLTERGECKSIMQLLSAKVDEIGNANGGKHDNHTLAIIEMDCSSVLKESLSNRLLSCWKLVITMFTLVIALGLYGVYVLQGGGTTQLQHNHNSGNDFLRIGTIYTNGNEANGTGTDTLMMNDTTLKSFCDSTRLKRVKASQKPITKDTSTTKVSTYKTAETESNEQMNKDK